MNLQEKSKDIKSTALEMAVNSGRGHLGGAFSIVDILVSLYYDRNMTKEDDLVLSKGHAAIALYAMFKEGTDEFCKDGSLYTEHPNRHMKNIKLTTGSLGHGVGIAAGKALARKMDGKDSKVFVIAGDGECLEGSVYEAITFAVTQKLGNLILIIDNNNLMSLGEIPENVNYYKLFNAMGCEVSIVDGHDYDYLRYGFSKCVVDNGVPKVILARTKKGSGVSFMENSLKWHNGVPKGELLEIARKELSHE